MVRYIVDVFVGLITLAFLRAFVFPGRPEKIGILIDCLLVGCRTLELGDAHESRPEVTDSIIPLISGGALRYQVTVCLGEV